MRSDKLIAIVTIAAIVSVGVIALGSMAFNHESAGITVPHEARSIDVDAPGGASEYWYNADRLSVHPYADAKRVILNGAPTDLAALYLRIEVPSNGGLFRYLEVDWKTDEGASVVSFCDSLYGMTLYHDARIGPAGRIVYSEPKGTFGEGGTHNFDKIELRLIGSNDISVPSRWGCPRAARSTNTSIPTTSAWWSPSRPSHDRNHARPPGRGWKPLIVLQRLTRHPDDGRTPVHRDLAADLSHRRRQREKKGREARLKGRGSPPVF